MKIVSVILARAGSKRIPKKNIFILNNKPLIEYTIEDSLKSGIETWVFTDMPEVKEICKKYNVIVRDKLFENDSGIHETGKELFEYNKEMQADHLILLQITSPLRDVEKIKKWIDLYVDGRYDVGFAAHQLKTAFYYNMYGEALNYNICNRNYNSNLKAPIYVETGSFYIFRSEQIIKNHIMNSENKVIFEDPYNIDIDNIEDLLNAKK